MNTYNFTGVLFSVKQKHPVGYSSKAARQAFKDIRRDKSMRVHQEIFGMDELCSIILTEDILCGID